MAASTMSAGSAGGGRRRRRRAVMSEINVTPFVDVMLVLLIVFMVSAPLLDGRRADRSAAEPGQGVAAGQRAADHFGERRRQSLPADKQIKLDDLVPKLKAIIDARGGDPNELIYVRGDKKVDYGTMMRVMGRISGAGYHKVALVTEVEQGGQ